MKFITLEAATAFQNALDSIGETTKVIVCGSAEDQQYIAEGIDESEQNVEDIINDAKEIDVAAWFGQRKTELAEEFELDLETVVGDWLGEPEAKQGFTLALDIMTGELLPSVCGAELDLDQSWKIPAHFKYGGWNDCPNSELHCAIWRYWQEKYGAEIVGLSNDVIEAYIANPPQTKEAAIELAWEQYLYCSDIVDQGVETISNLATSILNHQVWYFWWD